MKNRLLNEVMVAAEYNVGEVSTFSVTTGVSF